ncbi:carboxymuconolactone decarboxylase family protein [Nocardioides mesophilus]|uniref:Carboxymuconolactone decarboxylase family protein n=1 Tax=Nocardioides mesophilus TaxID=433659 RepID=A0A7G9RG42_9ACTN|nr:carboxymuconolactone decarboxylase family protein [Nocardioides mesophilus]QNN54567.1 carboxymuconolactone decarboxylase family protein [Nocardioides mesophilus]
MPPLGDRELTPDQQRALQRITAGPRGKLLGPFAVLLRTPGLMDRVQEVGAYLRYEKALEPRLFELVVLMVARRWDQDFEWAHHHPLALAAGLPPDVVEAVGEDRREETTDQAVALVWELVDQLQRRGGIDDDVYARAVRQLGEEGVIEVVVAVGYYTTLALVMNVARTPPEAGPKLPPRAGVDA